MSTNMFSESGLVEIQGAEVLNFVSLGKDAVEFEINGLRDPVIRLIDKRADVKKTMARVLKTGEVETLAAHFNKPARIKLFPTKDGQAIVQLEKTRAKQHKHMLWVAIGIKGEIPYYEESIKLQIEPYKERTFVLLYLFKRPVETMQE